MNLPTLNAKIEHQISLRFPEIIYRVIEKLSLDDEYEIYENLTNQYNLELGKYIDLKLYLHRVKRRWYSDVYETVSLDALKRIDELMSLCREAKSKKDKIKAQIKRLDNDQKHTNINPYVQHI